MNRDSSLGGRTSTEIEEFKSVKLGNSDLWLHEECLLTSILNSSFTDLSNSYPNHKRRFAFLLKVITKL
jgi:hypothetical protein